MTLTTEQKVMLEAIVNDKYGYAPFAGMVFNKAVDSKLDIESLIKMALDVRIKMKEMIK